jgi:hypothetical protein
MGTCIVLGFIAVTLAVKSLFANVKACRKVAFESFALEITRRLSKFPCDKAFLFAPQPEFVLCPKPLHTGNVINS